MTVAELQQRIDSREFSSWLAYDRVDPFGEERADLRSAIVASVIANANRGRNTPPFRVHDFMPNYEIEARREQTPEEMYAVLFGPATKP